MTTLTAATVKRSFLEPTLDARALNLEQRRLIFDPSDESDSLLEVLVLLTASSRRSEVAPPLALAGSLTRRIATSNGREGRLEVAVAATADRLATDLRDLELNYPAERPLAAKAIARALREPLRELLGPASDPRAYVQAAWRVKDVLQAVPREQLLSTTVEHELGIAKFALLRELAARHREVFGTAAPKTPRARPTDAARECSRS